MHNPVEYWLIQTENMRAGLVKRAGSMEVADFDAAAGAILKNGGQVAMPKFTESGTCWQGYFLDPQGNTFGVFQLDPNAR
jgi:uncharacterized protein